MKHDGWDEKHKDTEAQRRALTKPWMRAFVPLCLCVSVFSRNRSRSDLSI